MPGRTIAFGDVHGSATALAALLEKVNPQPDDVIVGLGDYVDRGPDTKGVIEIVRRLADRCQVVALRGNHEVMMLSALQNVGNPKSSLEKVWKQCGGEAALDSYGGKLADVPDDHREFLEQTQRYYETETHIFVHASYTPHLPMSEQPEESLFWTSLRELIPPPHQSGKTVVVGHTPQKSGRPFDGGYIKGIDTFAWKSGWLTGYDVQSGEVWQVNRDGRSNKQRVVWSNRIT